MDFRRSPSRDSPPYPFGRCLIYRVESVWPHCNQGSNHKRFCRELTIRTTNELVRFGTGRNTDTLYVKGVAGESSANKNLRQSSILLFVNSRPTFSLSSKVSRSASLFMSLDTPPTTNAIKSTYVCNVSAVTSKWNSRGTGGH